MDGNNWRANSGQAQVPGQVMGGEVPAAPGMDAGDWRTQLPADSRQRIVNKIMDTLKRHLPFSGQDGLQELKKIAVRFEEKTYTGATSQSDYLRKISLKMLTMETKSQNTMSNSLQSNAPSNSKNPQDPASQSIQSQMPNQGQPLPIQMVPNQSQMRQQLLSQNIQNNMPSTGVPNSASMTPSLPPVGGVSQATMPNVVGQNPNMQNLQNISNVAPNVMGNSMGQGVPSNMFVNTQRSIQGRQQPVVPQEQQQQSQNSQQYLYNQQLQHLMKQKFQQGNISQSLVQSQIQQQQQHNLLQPTQIQSSQQALMQASLRQPANSSSLQQNQQSSIHQSTQPMLQQQSQSLLRQQQSQQSSLIHQQQTSISQHSILPTQQQQQLSGQQPNATSLQQNQLIGQQNNILDAQQHQQQQRMMSQQNNHSNLQQQQTIGQQNLPNIHQQQSIVQQSSLPNVHQQQLGPQTNVSGFQQQQMVGIQSGNSGLQNNQQSVHMLQQSKVAVQQQIQQNMANLLPTQAQQSQSQSQSQPPQQQVMSQTQSQPGQLQHQLALQRQANSLQRDMHQRIQTSGPLLQQHISLDQQKHLVQSHRAIAEASLSSLDSSSQTGNANGGDWQEEIFQKIRSMNDMYFPELNEMYQKMAAKLQKHDSLPQQPKNDPLGKLRKFKGMLEHLLLFLRISKNEVQQNHKEKIIVAEKQIINILNSNKPRQPVSSMLQGQLSQPHLQTVQQSLQPQSQISQMHPLENQMNSQMQPVNVQGSMTAVQQNNVTNSLSNSSSSVSGVSNSRQNMMDALQSGSTMDPGQGNALNSLQQVAMGSLQQNPASGPQQVNMNSVSSHSGLSTLQSNHIPLQPNSNILSNQHVKQEPQVFPTQQIKQQFQQQRQQHQQQQQQQQHMQRQHLIQQQQQQQQQHQTNQQQSVQLAAHQMLQLHQMNETNEMKMRQQMGVKSGVLQQHHSSGQRSSYHQPLKPGTPFSTSSPQVLQVASPQVHLSPQIDQQNLLTSHPKTGTPLQSANSPFVVPSPSTSMAPSIIPGEFDKMNSVVASLSNAGNPGHHQTTGASIPAQSLAIGTPGISASPLLAEFTSPDGTHGVVSTIVSGNSNVVEQPLERLLKVVKSMSLKALSSSVSDISSVVSMIDRIAGSAPGNGSRAAVGEDLVAMTKCRLQARNFFSQDGSSGTKRMRRYTSAMPSNVVSSTGSVNDSFYQLNGTESDGESTGASGIKRPRIEANHRLEEELQEINERLIDTVVYISDEVVDPTAVAATAKGGDGTIVKCSFSAVALSPNLKSQYASAQMSPIQPLRLLVPNNYPNCSPILLDRFPVEVSKEYEDLSIKAKSRFSISLRTLSQPMSLSEIARTWDICARAVISEYAQQSGGGSFSSKYGTWENCLTTA
ncbi:mediator of RNA polymerase II transcription subunit 15a-like isoform X1 [Olea europaea var. sylvestris]|uniref:mediator of RNA polymerase II transcription subunit 15a-like isoform X1 n=1 Tax=Olea europaea var. sylvestris TaxID=158386 RepID=UPI000C1D08DC|nr:mediator of RNA polymerase II transcription subunit 15a-like isoform X1 [Olea europaea var. sylvestris]